MEEASTSRVECVDDPTPNPPLSVLASPENDAGNHALPQPSHASPAVGVNELLNDADSALSRITSEDESSGFGVVGAPSAELSAYRDAPGEDSGCSLDTDDHPGTVGEQKAMEKRMYSRVEMEALRYCNLKDQKKLWLEIYNRFSVIARTEYGEMGSINPQRKQSRFRGSSRGDAVGGDLEIPLHMDCTCDEEYSEEEDEDSDGSIQRPAFFVEGEPDFDSGPPEDGLEYLRRVRWEAAQIPKVKVAKLDKSKVHREQSVYMPHIPEIERCPEHVAPLKQWEEEFLCDFSELRLAISRMDGCHTSSRGTAEAVGEPTWSAGPTLSTILKMDLVRRVSMLKRQISLFQSKDELSRNECLWLFALCAAIDTPLDADTSASLRALLRKCSKLRAAKPMLDDEAVMLNILVTISGNFFGQADKFLVC